MNTRRVRRQYKMRMAIEIRHWRCADRTARIVLPESTVGCVGSSLTNAFRYVHLNKLAYLLHPTSFSKFNYLLTYTYWYLNGIYAQLRYRLYIFYA